ncbi:MAG: thermonuclease family protein [Nitrosomonadales bacterium]|nr:thermonuclease family protein [Nitrosomonadales bacterium]
MRTFAGVVCLLLPLLAAAQDFNAKVIAVLDGDTVLVLRGNRPVKVRLADIDAPEKDQRYGQSSKQSLVELALRREVRVSTRAVDKYGRIVAQLRLEGRDLNAEQVRRGMAWEYAFKHSNPELRALQQDARAARRGLWAQATPTSPWQWRKMHSSAPAPVVAPHDFTCGSKHRCVQMRSCDEAHFYLSHCGVRALDEDGDGLPCPALCEALAVKPGASRR